MRLDNESGKWLRSLLGEAVLFDVSMSCHTRFQVGGPAPALAQPGDLLTLKQLTAGLKDRKIPFMLVGGGTNLLVSDKGLWKVVIVLTNGLNAIRYGLESGSNVVLEALAGARLPSLCRFALEHGLLGAEALLGIPGTVGGAVRMNAGTRIGAVADILCSAWFLMPDGRVMTFLRNELDFRYRALSGKDGAIVLGAAFRLSKDGISKKQLKAISRNIIAKRRASQPRPAEGRSAGCFFKNPQDGPPAGALIDRAGLKGAQVGGAMVSMRHANFIVNTGAATASDILNLKDQVQEAVLKQFGLFLTPEVEIVG